jgi:hypothetical protein
MVDVFNPQVRSFFGGLCVFGVSPRGNSKGAFSPDSSLELTSYLGFFGSPKDVDVYSLMDCFVSSESTRGWDTSEQKLFIVGSTVT